MALQRFMALEKKLSNDLKLAVEYKAFMKEYEDLGHKSRVDDRYRCSTKNLLLYSIPCGFQRVQHHDKAKSCF